MSTKQAWLVVATAVASLATSAVVAAPAQAVRSISLSAKPLKSAGKGFSPVRQLSGQARSVLAVGDDVWVAEKGGDGKVLLERSRSGTWSTSTLPVTADNTLALSGSASDDVWLVSGGQLWHYTSTWTKQTLAENTTATAVLDVAGPDVFVGTRTSAPTEFGTDSYAELRRFDGTIWTSLGGPELPTQWTFAGSEPITRIRQVDGSIFAETNLQPPSSYALWQVYAVTGTRWTPAIGTGEVGHGANSRTPGWISYSATNQLFLGTENGEPQPAPICRTLINTVQSTCSTTTAVGAAVKLADGRVIIGGNDWRTSFIGQPKTYGQGTFRARATDGTETPIKGDPGEATVDLSTANAVVWAITTSGDRSTLQRYVP